jgi:hypothetical protein
MKWSEVDMSFRLEDHPTTELSNRNFPFVVKLPMSLNLAELTPVCDTFHDVIIGQSSTPIGCINQEVSYGSGDNKRKEMLTFEVASFNIMYNCILGRPFLLKFMAINHTAYATIKMPDPKGVIIIKADQRDALACENASLSHAN